MPSIKISLQILLSLSCFIVTSEGVSCYPAMHLNSNLPSGKWIPLVSAQLNIEMISCPGPPFHIYFLNYHFMQVLFPTDRLRCSASSLFVILVQPVVCYNRYFTAICHNFKCAISSIHLNQNNSVPQFTSVKVNNLNNADFNERICNWTADYHSSLSQVWDHWHGMGTMGLGLHLTSHFLGF